MKIALIGLASLMMIAPCNAIAGHAGSLCSGIEYGVSSPSDVDQYYAARAAEILQFAKQEDTSSLVALVAPEAKFNLWRGDYTTSARQSGPEGAIELARDLKPKHFLLWSPQSGPIAISGTPECKWSVSILSRGNDARSDFEMKFDFRDGLLVAAEGHQVALVESDVR